MRVDTQQQRALCFRVMQHILSATPFLVGSFYFMYEDEPAAGISKTFPEDSNYGLVSESDIPYADLTAEAKRINSTLVKVHAGQCVRLSVTAAGDTIVLKNVGILASKTPISLWINGVRSNFAVDLAPRGSYRVPNSLLKRSVDEGLYAHLECDPEQTLPKATTELQSADLILRPKAKKNGQRAVVVWNPSPYPLSDVYTQPDRENLNVHVDSLPAYGSRTIWMPKSCVDALPESAPVRFTKTADGYTIENGILRLIKNKNTGAIFDSVELSESPDNIALGSYFPLLNLIKENGETWTRADRIIGVDVVRQSPGEVVLDITAQHDSNEGLAFKCAYRIDIVAGEPCFRSRILWIENTNSVPLKCGDYYHYAPSAFGSTSASVITSDNLGAWRDPKQHIEYGVAAANDDSGVTVVFWKDESGYEHPDCRRTVGLDLQPGQRWRPIEYEPTVLIGGLREQSGESEFRTLIRQERARMAVRGR
jgi:hypothetical protein